MIRNIFLSLLAQSIWLCPLNAAGQPPQKQEGSGHPFLARHHEARQKNPEGVSFTLRLKEDKSSFKMGEIISLEFYFTSDLPNTYELIGRTYDRGGRLNLDKFFLNHQNGVADPLKDHMPGVGGGLSSIPILSEKPYKMTFDLNEWFRFDQPGNFQLYVTAPRVQQKGKSGNGGVAEVTSNIIEFEILPPDDKWAEAELREITKLLDARDATLDRKAVCRRLRFLTTEAAAREMVRRFVALPYSCEYEFSFGLMGSPHRAFVVKEMEKKLAAAHPPVSKLFLHTLDRINAAVQHERQLIPASPQKQATTRPGTAQTFFEMLDNSRRQIRPGELLSIGQVRGPDPRKPRESHPQYSVAFALSHTSEETRPFTPKILFVLSKVTH